MGFDYAYFAAASDREAGAAAQRTGGPLGWPTETGVRRVGWLRREPVIEELGPAFEGFAVRGYDTVTLQTLADLLRPGGGDDLRWGLDVTAADAEDSCGVQTVPSSFRDLLDEVGDEALRAAMAPWAQTEELRRWMDDSSTEEHLQFALRLRGLAHTARQSGRGLYLYWQE